MEVFKLVVLIKYEDVYVEIEEYIYIINILVRLIY